ncbi:hypothetical protein SLI_4232 [Streptomyces lividans 1326]|uniref:Uncharacterized protein n=1 Tax=Streptomyces lividans 1326 TaxID=1200984 RepID=A0A7U9HBT3_STRLI|nr:hypothetical protein SLI_4232 [Streptomyces lividans 1326]
MERGNSHLPTPPAPPHPDHGGSHTSGHSPVTTATTTAPDHNAWSGAVTYRGGCGI